MSPLLVIAMAVSGVATVFACVGLRKLWGWALYQLDPPARCHHGRKARLCPFCDHESRMAERLPGAAEGGSTYKHNEDDWFDKRRPAHPDRPDEDYN